MARLIDDAETLVVLQARNRVRTMEAVHGDMLRDRRGSIRVTLDTGSGWPVKAEAFTTAGFGCWIPTGQGNTITEALDDLDAVLTAARGRNPTMAQLADTLGVPVPA